MNHLNKSSINIIFRNEKYGDAGLRAVESLYAYAWGVMAYDDRMTQLKAERELLDPDEYQERVQSIDHTRSSRHNAAISSLSVLNNIAEKLSIDAVYTGEIEDIYRGNIAHAIFEFAKAKLDSDMYGSNWSWLEITTFAERCSDSSVARSEISVAQSACLGAKGPAVSVG